MMMLVHSFPTKLAALQFEWAWQNPQKSRQIKRVPGSTLQPLLTHSAPSTSQDSVSQPRRRQRRPIATVQEKMETVFHMLHSPAWRRWQLGVYCLDPEIRDIWDQVACSPAGIRIEQACPRGLSEVHVVSGSLSEFSQIVSVQTAQLERRQTKQEERFELFASLDSKCMICAQALDYQDPTTIATCTSPTFDCTLVTHLTCLASDLLKQEKVKSALGINGSTNPDEDTVDDHLLPTSGECPVCNEVLLWSTIIKNTLARKKWSISIE
ncbi:hypothetical protein BGZ73_003981 [Actinomortierella ambigua]|nr:hypothetical protein BGZ73_003981 [Actinomortierella ambigua]